MAISRNQIQAAKLGQGWTLALEGEAVNWHGSHCTVTMIRRLGFEGDGMAYAGGFHSYNEAYVTLTDPQGLIAFRDIPESEVLPLVAMNQRSVEKAIKMLAAHASPPTAATPRVAWVPVPRPEWVPARPAAVIIDDDARPNPPRSTEWAKIIDYILGAKVTRVVERDVVKEILESQCPACRGSGLEEVFDCLACKGTGRRAEVSPR